MVNLHYHKLKRILDLGGFIMKLISLKDELKRNSYPGRGIIIGKSSDGSKAVVAYL